MDFQKFTDLYSTTLGEQPPSAERLKALNDDLSLKRPEKDIHYFPIFADQPNSWQGDLMFEPWLNSSGQKILQAILCVININTRYAFATTVDYVKNVKAMEEREWSSKNTRVLLNNKDSSLVLQSFKRIQENMVYEAAVLNNSPQFKKHHVQFRVDRLYVDEGSEFMGSFREYCDSNNIHVIVFKASTGTKRRLGVVERFNRTVRRLIDKQVRLFGKKNLQEAIPNALDLYNRYLNHRTIQEFMLRQEKFKSKLNARFMPAMMLMPGLENEYITYCKEKTDEVRNYYAERMKQLQPNTIVQHYQPKGTFGNNVGVQFHNLLN